MVISLDSFNRRMATVVIAAVTTNVREGSPVSVTLPAGRPLARRSSVLAFQVMTAAQDRLRDYLGSLDSAQLRQLDNALRTSFGL